MWGMQVVANCSLVASTMYKYYGIFFSTILYCRSFCIEKSRSPLVFSKFAKEQISRFLGGPGVLSRVNISDWYVYTSVIAQTTDVFEIAQGVTILEAILSLSVFQKPFFAKDSQYVKSSFFKIKESVIIYQRFVISIVLIVRSKLIRHRTEWPVKYLYKRRCCQFLLPASRDGVFAVLDYR